jgi:hypothetical protein
MRRPGISDKRFSPEALWSFTAFYTLVVMLAKHWLKPHAAHVAEGGIGAVPNLSRGGGEREFRAASTAGKSISIWAMLFRKFVSKDCAPADSIRATRSMAKDCRAYRCASQHCMHLLQLCLPQLIGWPPESMAARTIRHPRVV